MLHTTLKSRYLKALETWYELSIGLMILDQLIKTLRQCHIFMNIQNQGQQELIDHIHGAGLKPVTAFYQSPSFTDHLALIVSYELPKHIERKLLPRSCLYFKVKQYILEDQLFRQLLEKEVKSWMKLHKEGVLILTVWERLVKLGIHQIACERQRDIEFERNEKLQMLFLKQHIYTSYLQDGDFSAFALLKETQMKIEQHYVWESEKITIQARTDAACESEKTRIYHHSLLRRNFKSSAIIKLDTEEGFIYGHDQCMDFLEREVMDLFSNIHYPNHSNEKELLDEIEPVFTQDDNDKLLLVPEENEVKNVISSSELSAAPGEDGISSMVYKNAGRF